MIVLFAIMLSLFGYYLFLSQQFHLMIEETPLIVVAVVAVALYLFALANLLVAGVYILLAAGWALLAFVLVRKRKTLGVLFRNVFSPGMSIFIAGIPVIYLLARPMLFGLYDEFSHWGLIAKAIYTAGGLPPAGSMLTFPAYPEGTALFQFFFCRLFGWKEGVVIFAHTLMLWSAAAAFTKGMRWKHIPLAVLAMVIVYTAYIRFGVAMWSVYVDGMLGVMAGGAFALYYHSGERNPADVLKTVPVLAFIPLMKESGLFLSVLLCALMAADQLYLSGKPEKAAVTGRNPVRRHPYAFALLPALLLPIFIDVSWSIYLSAAGISNGEVFHQHAANSPNIVELFIQALAARAVGRARAELPFFGSAAFLLIMLLSAFAVWMAAVRDRGCRHRLSVLMGGLLAGFVLYSVGLVYVYMFRFSAYEGERLASYSRYMGTYFLFFLISLAHVFIEYLSKNRPQTGTKWALIGATAVFAVYLLVMTPLGLFNFFVRKTADPVRSEISSQMSVIRKAAKPDQKVYILWQDTDGTEYYKTKYELYPIRTNGMTWSIGTPYDGEDIFTIGMSANDWEKALREYRYVYVGKTDAQFEGRFGELFQDGSVKNNTIYTVEIPSGGRILLTPMNEP